MALNRFRFIHAADLHLDSPFAGLSSLPKVIRDCLRHSTFAALANLVAIAIQHKVDFVLISGDVYDLADRSLRAQIRFQKAMGKLAELGIPVYIVHGNHDPVDGRAANLTWPSSVHFFSSREVESMPVQTPDRGTVARIYGMSYATSAVTDNLALKFRKISGEEQVYAIGLLHSNVAAGVGGHANYAPCTKQELLQSGMNYWALGHVHTRQVLHEEPPIVYPGNIQGRNIREIGAKGCYLVDVNEQGQAKLLFQPLDAVRWQQLQVSIEGLLSAQALRDRLMQQLEHIRLTAEGRPIVVRLSLIGRGPLHNVLQQGTYLRELIAEIREEEAALASAESQTNFVWIESVQLQSGINIDRDVVLEEKSFLGDLLRLADSMRDDEYQLLTFGKETLKDLVQHPKAGKYLPQLSLHEVKGGLKNGLKGEITDEMNNELLDLLKAAEELAIDLLAADAGWDT